MKKLTIEFIFKILTIPVMINVDHQTDRDNLPASTKIDLDDLSTKLQQPLTSEKIICSHCLRTATNGIKCKGICVADSDY